MKTTTLFLTIGFLTPFALSGHAIAALLTPAAATEQPSYSTITNSVDAHSITTQENEHEQTPTSNPLWSIPLSKLSETRLRPLFTPSRRPPLPVVTPSQPTSTPKSTADQLQLALVGTIINNDERFGLFIDPITKTLVRLKAGGEYQGWILKSVTKREVVLEKSRVTTTLSLPRHDQKL
jgi:hypothetical protein